MIIDMFITANLQLAESEARCKEMVQAFEELNDLLAGREGALEAAREEARRARAAEAAARGEAAGRGVEVEGLRAELEVS
jgi:hypothetical protein